MKPLIAIALLSLSLAGCKQGLGERCQVDSDCLQGTCSKAEPRVCGGSDTSQRDADPIPDQVDAAIDAPAIDARAIDAPDAHL